MKRSFSRIFFVLFLGMFYTSSALLGQTGTSQLSQNSLASKIKEGKKRYSMRSDFMTESQMDDIIKLGSISIDELCAYTMGCQNRKDVILNIGDRIQLFKDARIKQVELIRIDENTKTSIGTSVTTSEESYITVNQKITRENVDNFMLLILK